MWILTKLRIFYVLIILKLIFHSTFFRHHFGSRNLHVVNDKLVSEELVLLVLTLKVFNRNQHFLNVFEDEIESIYSPIDNHLIRFIFSKQLKLQRCQLVHISWSIFTDTCSVHFSCLNITVPDTEVTRTTISKEYVISNNSNFVSDDAVIVIFIRLCFVLAKFSVSRDAQHELEAIVSEIQILFFRKLRFSIRFSTWGYYARCLVLDKSFQYFFR